MKLFRILIALFYSSLILTSASSIENKVPAFPGAEGFGKYALGGRGGELLTVTNLNNDGPGSLRYAIEAEWPRIIVFSVSGLINLETPILIRNPYITIAGQTAPDKGIAISGNQLHIQTHNVVIRFLRVRVGDINFGKKNNWNSVDGIDIGFGESENVHDIIIDHCSISWGTDENIGVWGKVHNVTIQNSIISEALSRGKHVLNRRGRGILVGPKAERISILNNLFINNDKRNPRMGNAGFGDVRNNIIYNPGFMGINVWNSLYGDIQFLNIVRNIFIPGPNTDFTKEISLWDPSVHPGKIYLADNIGFNGSKPYDNWEMVEDAITPRNPITISQIERVKSDTEFPSEISETKSFQDMHYFAQNYIGASLPRRDEVDIRLIYEMSNRSGKIISSQDEVGGWPVYTTGINVVDLFGDTKSGDVISESWRIRYNIWFGEDNEDFNGNGYTNIEEFLNGTNPRSDSAPQALDIFKTFRTNDNEINDLELKQNFPNPFYDSTKIRFIINKQGLVTLNIMDVSGNLVGQLANAYLMPGQYETIWLATSIPPGIYIASLRANGSIASIRIMKSL